MFFPLDSARYRTELGKLMIISKKNEPVLQEQVQIPLCEKFLWRKYRNRVWKITQRQALSTLPNFKERGFKEGYHLDHKVSIWFGYKNKLSAELIGSISNLEFIPWKENLTKSTRCNFKNSIPLQTTLFI